MTDSFWTGKRVLITGNTGFKGAWLSLWLAQMGAEITGYSLDPPTKPNLFELIDLQSDITSVQGDIRDLPTLEGVFAQAKPEIVFHLAAQALVQPSYADPVDTYASNVMGTVNILEVVRRTNGVKAALIITSDKCYENREQIWGYRECDPMGGHDPYSSSKGCAELVVSAYRNSFFPPELHQIHGVSVASARAGNVIGNGDWAENRLIPDILRSFERQEPLLIRSPGAIRPWQYVLDPLYGYLILAEKMFRNGAEYGSGWNFGPSDDDAKPVSWIADFMTRLWSNGAEWKNDATQYPHEAKYLKLDCSKARNLLGWRPCMDIGTTLQWIVEWYQALISGKDMRQECEQELMRYMNLMNNIPSDVMS